MYTTKPSNPYSPSGQDLDVPTPPIDEIIRQAFFGFGLDLRVCLPCQVVGMKLGLVDLQPLIKTRSAITGDVKDLPVLKNVPIGQPQGKTWSIQYPVAIGDTGYAIFADRSLDVWLAGPGISVDPQDSRQHDLNDAIFCPGLVPIAQQKLNPQQEIILTNGVSKLTIQKTGQFKLENTAAELLDTLTQIVTQLNSLTLALSTETVNTILGPMPLNHFAQYATIYAQLTTLLAKLTSLKGV